MPDPVRFVYGCISALSAILGRIFRLHIPNHENIRIPNLVTDIVSNKNVTHTQNIVTRTQPAITYGGITKAYIDWSFSGRKNVWSLEGVLPPASTPLYMMAFSARICSASQRRSARNK